jgi:hypothetical protein
MKKTQVGSGSGFFQRSDPGPVKMDPDPPTLLFHKSKLKMSVNFKIIFVFQVYKNYMESHSKILGKEYRYTFDIGNFS